MIVENKDIVEEYNSRFSYLWQINTKKKSEQWFKKKMESKQYNAILVIPIIQKNVNLSGLVDKIPDAITVYDSYFKQSETGAVDTLGNATTTFEYGPQNDEIYKDVSFWSSHGYDFVGNDKKQYCPRCGQLCDFTHT